MSANRRPVVRLAHTKVRVGKNADALKSGLVKTGPTVLVATALQVHGLADLGVLH